jgi:hypothetical protein
MEILNEEFFDGFLKEVTTSLLNLGGSYDNIETNVSELNRAKLNDDKINVNINGIKNEKSIGFLFSNVVDTLINTILTKLERGENLESLFKDENTIRTLFNNFGVGTGAFTGTISKAILNTVSNTVSGDKFKNTKSKLLKIFSVFKDLKKTGKDLTDKIEKAKYFKTLEQIKKTIKFIANIYRNREVVTNQFKKAAYSLVFEDTELETVIPVL